jgi:Mn-dependent DtxR family transcriptional regulator
VRSRAVKSPWSAALLLLLRDSGPQSSVQLAGELGMNPSEVDAYLYYFKSKGLVTRDCAVWKLTTRGTEYVDKHRMHLEHIVSAFRIKLAKVSESRLKLAKEALLERIRSWAGDVYDDCRDVIDLVLYWSENRGTYIELLGDPGGQLAELLEETGISSNASPFRALECLRALRARGVLYVYQRNGVAKVRLNKHLLRGLDLKA